MVARGYSSLEPYILEGLEPKDLRSWSACRKCWVRDGRSLNNRRICRYLKREILAMRIQVDLFATLGISERCQCYLNEEICEEKYHTSSVFHSTSCWKSVFKSKSPA